MGLYLNYQTQTLTAKLGSAPQSHQPVFRIICNSWKTKLYVEEKSPYLSGFANNQGALNGTTEVSLLPENVKQATFLEITFLSIYNIDTASIDVEILLTDSSSSYHKVHEFMGTLEPYERAAIASDGVWRIYDATGKIKENVLPGVETIQGAPGPQGLPGQDGDTGSEGPAGPQGLQGETGSQGPQGLQGPEGDQGLQGPIGNPGPQGLVGPKGDEGDQGSQGIQGLTGNTGPQGSQGIQGIAGPQGEVGPQGDQGEIGDTGPQGIQGLTGPQGTTGPQGETGNIGPQGSQGQQGIQGLKGDTGDIGPEGPQGETGDTGPQGAPGPQGIQGLTGNTGSQGIQGPTGATGPQGETGATGSQGPQGNTGPQGIQGLTGNTGPQGSQGIQGPEGQDGQGIFGQATIDFGSNNISPVLTVTILDSGVTEESIINLNLRTGPGRDSDEMEMEDFSLFVADILPGIGFNATIVNGQSGGAHGQYILNYSRS